MRIIRIEKRSELAIKPIQKIVNTPGAPVKGRRRKPVHRQTK